jgi:P27 family predicted phage terminase small subunit
MQRPLALNCWTKHAAALLEDGRLTAQSVDNFVMMCHYQADAADHEAKIAAEGTVIVTSKGMIPHPATMLLERARRSFLRMSQEFGLTPASYARLPLGKPNAEAVNEEEALLRRFTG